MSIVDSHIRAFSNCNQVMVAWKYEQHIPNCVGFAIFRKIGDEPDTLTVPQSNNVEYVDFGDGENKIFVSTQRPIKNFIWFDHSVMDDETVSYMVVPVTQVGPNRYRNDRLNASNWSNRVNLSLDVDLSCFFNGAFLSTYQNALIDEKLGGRLVMTITRLLADAVAEEKTSIHALLHELGEGEIANFFKKLNERSNVLTATDNSIRDLNNIYKLESESTLVNSFIVFANEETTKVWIGTPSLTKTCLYNQFNHGIIIDNSQLAKTYLDEWNRIKGKSGTPVGVCSHDGITTWIGEANTEDILQQIKGVINNVATRNLLFLMSDDETANSIYNTLKDTIKKQKKRILTKGIIINTVSGEDFVFDDGVVKKIKRQHGKVNLCNGEFIIVADAFDENPVIISGTLTDRFINPMIIRGKNLLAVHYAIQLLSIYTSLKQGRNDPPNGQWLLDYYKNPKASAELEFVLGPGYPPRPVSSSQRLSRPMWLDKQEWSKGEEKYWDEQKELMKGIRVGGVDASGNTIARVITRADEYVIYEIQTSILSDSVKVIIRSIVEKDTFLIERFDGIRVAVSKIKGQLFKVNDDVSYKGRIGHIISHALSSGDTAAANDEFNKLENEIDDIYAERFWNSLRYLSTIMGLAACLAVLAIWTYACDWFIDTHTLIRTLIFTAASGSLGGFLSVSRRLRTMSFEKEIPSYTYFFYGLERVTVSVCGAFIVILAVKSGLGGVIIKDFTTGTMILAVVAGFSETLIPNILVKIEAEQTDKKK